jgi:hypothetical protein
MNEDEQLTKIVQLIQIFVKGFVANNPSWDHSRLLGKVRQRAQDYAEDFNFKISNDHMAVIEKKALRGLQGTAENATFFEDDKEQQEDWLSNKKKKNEIDFMHWKAYRSYLSAKPNWTEGENGTLTKLDLNTERILSKLSNPNGPSTVRKGMVVGNVQSGKTANYIGLITKAADAGYKVIVVLAGILEFKRKLELRKDLLVKMDVPKNLLVLVKPEI